jgi:phosphoenolpyruvate-protein kinase (PTS system EI component)
VARTVEAARVRGIPVDVCGEAASELNGLQAFVGLGVDEISVGAARVGLVRCWLRGLVYQRAAELARLALAASTAEEVEELFRVAGESLRECGDAGS